MLVYLHQVILLSVLVAAGRSLPAVAVPFKDKSSTPTKFPFKASEDDAVPLDRYVTHNEMTTWLQGLAKRHPNFVKVTSIGKSAENRDLWVLELSHSVGRGQRDLLMPMVKLIANMHGNEVVGRQLLLNLISYLIEKDGIDESVTRMLNTTDIFFLPSMNPDGFHKAQEGDCWEASPESGRLNAQNVDLNRDFPDQFKAADKNLKTVDDFMRNRAPETKAVIKWIMENPFVLSTSLHGGSVVASYPFDDSENHQSQEFYSASPDDEVFRQLSKDYADRHPLMKRPGVCGGGFKDGITNGAHWYDVQGGMQDFNYVHSNAFENTLELSCCKYPPDDDLPAEWQNNRKALLNFIAWTHRGVRGLVFNKATKQPVANAQIIVEGIGKNITTTSKGEYWRLLVPGNYTIQCFADGYLPSDKLNIQLTNTYSPKQINFEMVEKQIM